MLRGDTPPLLTAAETVAAVAAGAIVVVEAVTRSQARYGPECLVAGLALVYAWQRRSELRGGFVVALAFALPAAIALVHLARHAQGDVDVQHVYPMEGQQLLHGHYPHSEYPPGAVLLFAGEEMIGSARSVNGFVMALCAVAIVWAIASLRTPAARWLALFVVVWPVNAFFWEFKFDALPTALLAAGAVAAVRQRWVVSGMLFGLGAAVKWSPALSALMLGVWLISRGEVRHALRHGAGFALGFCALVVPSVAWDAPAVWASVTRQAPRTITAESFWYLPLHALGQASKPGGVYDAARVPNIANTAVVAIQLSCLAALAVLLAIRRPPLQDALAVALLAPISFLLLNKVFSPQYYITILAAACLAAAISQMSRLLPPLLALATAANILVYPIGFHWLAASLLLFTSGLAAVVLLLGQSLRSPQGSANGPLGEGRGQHCETTVSASC